MIFENEITATLVFVGIITVATIIVKIRNRIKK